MCWIFAYTGKNDCREALIHGLRKLEYRWYDSAWLIGISEQQDVCVKKAVGRVSALASKIDEQTTPPQSSSSEEKVEQNGTQGESIKYTTGIAHTRWATHGKVTTENTHPHSSSNERFYIVHNGIIENYKELKKSLEADHRFYWETDTEVVAKLIETLYDGDIVSTMQKVIRKLVWAYSLAVVDTQQPGTIVAIKLGSPLIVWQAEDGIYLSSDVNAMTDTVESYTILEDHEMVVISDEKYTIYMSGDEVVRDAQNMQQVDCIDDLWEFDTYTQKEIFEIPSVLENVFSGRVHFSQKDIHNETLTQLTQKDISRICIISSGSSYYAGDIGCYFFRKFALMPATAVISSEFLSDTFVPDEKTLYIFLSQSWETADVRESMKIVQAKAGHTFAIVNVVGSTIARMADAWLYSHAGVEIGVASTKNVIAQVALLLITALSFGKKRDMQMSEFREIITELETLPDTLRKVLLCAPKIGEVAKKYAKYEDMFVLGRNYFYPVAGEASLKCKELSYIHSEAYSAWELKHGPLALVNKDFPTMVFNPMWSFYAKTISNIQEVAARNGPILGYITPDDTHKELYTDTIELPKTSELIAIFTSLTASYIFALYIAEALGRDVDKPRNLAKSVTVE